MAMIEILGTIRDIELAVFDKDGTLVDFDRLWTGKLTDAVSRIARHAPLGPDVAATLLRTLGVDSVRGRVIPESPLAVSSLPKLGVVCATVLHQAGFPWHAAEMIVQEHFLPAIETAPDSEALLPIGDLVGLFGRLKGAGIETAVFTSDSRAPTQASLALLGLAPYVERMVCGDDDLPNKPAPDGLLHLARAFGITPEKIMMVGDSVADMRAGRNAGIGLCVGVLSGTGVREDMALHADVIAPDIHAIRLAPAR